MSSISNSDNSSRDVGSKVWAVREALLAVKDIKRHKIPCTVEEMIKGEAIECYSNEGYGCNLCRICDYREISKVRL